MKLVGRIARASLVGRDFVRVPYPPWDVLVAIVDGSPWAIEDACNHAGASLSEGARNGDQVSCPMHGYIFSLRTGELITPRRLCDAQRTFVAEIEGDDVVIWDPFLLDVVKG